MGAGACEAGRGQASLHTGGGRRARERKGARAKVGVERGREADGTAPLPGSEEHHRSDPPGRHRHRRGRTVRQAAGRGQDAKGRGAGEPPLAWGPSGVLSPGGGGGRRRGSPEG
ncbi:hypothetical protein DPEC_G00232420 [Dallia pectoralis]|uniref:Uncharacterized protein n=1 Tax=Dallia pectoralis TaxID=75939 RepID=A0ACC2FXG7_DALPE|nr:hypothetical protein DPEC_G00232420 [Dallia pectoralis]